jgi:acetoin utilization deacetylase AcuC-like enzyme
MAVFYDEPRVLYASIHQYPHYPGTGRPEEVGTGSGEGTTLNIAFPGGQIDDDYSAAMRELIIPVGKEYAPELIIVSAGFDAHRNDPLAAMSLTAGGYDRMSAALMELSGLVDARVLFLLEGGYDLTGLREGVYSMLRRLVGGDSSGWNRGHPTARGRESISLTRSHLTRYYQSLTG